MKRRPLEFLIYNLKDLSIARIMSPRPLDWLCYVLVEFVGGTKLPASGIALN